jgi:hypothetical protein
VNALNKRTGAVTNAYDSRANQETPAEKQYSNLSYPDNCHKLFGDTSR